MNPGAWIGVDLDGTLAQYDGWKGMNHIGEPVPAMVARVKAWIEAGIRVKIMTARVSQSVYRPEPSHVFATIQAIQAWCTQHIGCPLEVTCIKDFAMVELWDDRAIQVEENTGRRMDGKA
jgi:hypothetical protein